MELVELLGVVLLLDGVALCPDMELDEPAFGSVVLLLLEGLAEFAPEEPGFACCEFCEPVGCEYDGLLVFADPEVPIVLLGELLC